MSQAGGHVGTAHASPSAPRFMAHRPHAALSRKQTFATEICLRVFCFLENSNRPFVIQPLEGFLLLIDKLERKSKDAERLEQSIYRAEQK